MATTEPEPGVWLMRTPLDYGPFGRIELRRVNVGLRYRVEYRGQLIGWSTTLQVACERLWGAYLEQIEKDRHGPPNGPRQQHESPRS